VVIFTQKGTEWSLLSMGEEGGRRGGEGDRRRASSHTLPPSTTHLLPTRTSSGPLWSFPKTAAAKGSCLTTVRLAFPSLTTRPLGARLHGEGAAVARMQHTRTHPRTGLCFVWLHVRTPTHGVTVRTFPLRLHGLPAGAATA